MSESPEALLPAASVEVEDVANNWKPSTNRSTKRIDGVVGLDRAARQRDERSVYDRERRGLLVIG